MASLARPCKENLMEFSSVYSSYVKENGFKVVGALQTKERETEERKTRVLKHPVNMSIDY